MGLLGWLFSGRGHGVEELARRLGVSADRLRAIQPQYRRFSVPKRSGGARQILAPEAELKEIQRLILFRLLDRLQVHSAATAYQRGRSIVTNARVHQGRAVVMRFDLIDYFPSTGVSRLRAYFRRIGWNRPATELLLRLCTRDGGLPQGAPTSPRLSNLVNYRLDARLAGMAAHLGAVYSRYADDLTISLAEDDGQKIQYLRRFVRHVVQAEGYQVHRRKKLSIRRRHDRQTVTGLVVNERANLPRGVRRWLRAVEHRARMHKRGLSDYAPLATSSLKTPTLTPEQLAGWRGLRSMIQRQSS